mgnify:CR=1 FL=1
MRRAPLAGERRAVVCGVVVTALDASGARCTVPAGGCLIGAPQFPARRSTIHWESAGVEHTASVTAEDLAAYLRGCMVQYV